MWVSTFKCCDIQYNGETLERKEKIKSALLWLNEAYQVINMTAIKEEYRHDEEHAFILIFRDNPEKHYS